MTFKELNEQKQQNPVSIEVKVNVDNNNHFAQQNQFHFSNFITEFISHFQYHNTVLWQTANRYYNCTY